MCGRGLIRGYPVRAVNDFQRSQDRWDWATDNDWRRIGRNGHRKGRMLLWRPGNGVFEICQLPGTAITTATLGGRVLAIDDTGQAVLFDGNGVMVKLSLAATSYGAAMNKDIAIWTERAGNLRRKVAEARARVVYQDTDLHALPFKAGRAQVLIADPGQQGFPSLSGNRLVWQESALKGNDIFTRTLSTGP